MIRVACPTGCGTRPRPYGLRTEPVRCTNCTAWFAASASAEDGSLVPGVLLASPGESLPREAPRRRWRWVIPALVVLVVLVSGGFCLFLRFGSR